MCPAGAPEPAKTAAHTWIASAFLLRGAWNLLSAVPVEANTEMSLTLFYHYTTPFPRFVVILPPSFIHFPLALRRLGSADHYI